MSSNEGTIPSAAQARLSGEEERRTSTLNLNTVLEAGDEQRKTFGSAEDQAIASIVEDRIANMDRDGDGRIDPKEMYVTMFDVAKEAIRQDKRIRTDRKIIYGLVGFSVVLAGCVFGTSVAAAYLAKDTQVNGSRALMTKSNEPVGINVNEVVIPLGSIAYLPEEVHKKVDVLTLKGIDGATHTRRTSAVSVVPRKSVTIWTTNGDRIAWDADDATAGREVRIELAEGASPSGGARWAMGAGCGTCTATSIVADESVVASVEEFYEEIIGVPSQEERRVLAERVLQGNSDKAPGQSGNGNGNSAPTTSPTWPVVICEPQPL